MIGTEGEGGLVLLFRKCQISEGRPCHIPREGDRVVHRVHLAHPLPWLTLPIIPRRLSTVFSPGINLRAKIRGIAPFNPIQSLVLSGGGGGVAVPKTWKNCSKFVKNRGKLR